MALFCTVIGRDSFSLLRFPFLSHIDVFSCEISLVCCLKYPYRCFSCHFTFLFFFLSVYRRVISIFCIGCNQSSSALFYLFFDSLYRCIDAIFNPRIPFTSLFLDAYSLPTSSLGCKAYGNVFSFLVLWSIWLCSFLINFKNGSEYLTRGTAHVFNPIKRLNH